MSRMGTIQQVTKNIQRNALEFSALSTRSRTRLCQDRSGAGTPDGSADAGEHADALSGVAAAEGEAAASLAVHANLAPHDQ